MAEIVPFMGIHYSIQKLGALDDLVAPPYDVISTAEQDALYAASPDNVIRIILNRGDSGDPYAEAGQFLRSWLDSGILVQDDEPCLYSYVQKFDHPATGDRLTRTGIFCALKLEPYSAGVVLPHEETRAKAKEDRLNLMRATKANPEPIFALYEDQEGLIARAVAAAPRASEDIRVSVGGDTHQVQRIADPSAIQAIRHLMEQKRIWIADGHHRYETALSYRDERRAAEPAASTPPYDYILAVLVAFEDPGLLVLPTHRLVRNVAPDRLHQLPLLLERYFAIEAVDTDAMEARMKRNREEGQHSFGMLTAGRAYLLTLRDDSVMAVENRSPAWKRLDVSILQTLVLDRSLGIPAADLATTPEIGYIRDADEAREVVRSGAWQLAFLLNQPSADEVRLVAAAGDKMPPKSTFFHPKLWSGLLLRDLE